MKLNWRKSNLVKQLGNWKSRTPRFSGDNSLEESQNSSFYFSTQKNRKRRRRKSWKLWEFPCLTVWWELMAEYGLSTRTDRKSTNPRLWNRHSLKCSFGVGFIGKKCLSTDPGFVSQTEKNCESSPLSSLVFGKVHIDEGNSIFLYVGVGEKKRLHKREPREGEMKKKTSPKEIENFPLNLCSSPDECGTARKHRLRVCGTRRWNVRQN